MQKLWGTTAANARQILKQKAVGSFPGLDRQCRFAMLRHRMSPASPANYSWLPSTFRRFAIIGGAAILIFLGLAGTGCRTAATRQISNPVPAVARLRAGGSIHAEADRLVKPLLAGGEVFGMVVGVVTPDGATQSFGYGRTGRIGDTNAPGPDDLFQIGSVSKLFTEALLVQLETDGKIRDDDTVRDILPTNWVVSAEAGRLTVHQLATHTSGLPREPMTLSQLGSFLDYLVTGRDLYAHLTIPYLQDYLRHAKPRPKTPPEFIYSNLGAGLLAYLITEKTGRPATDLIEEKICRPLRMNGSVFSLTPEQQSRLAVGHVGNQACWKPANCPLPPWDMGDLLQPIAGMYSSMNDMLVFARANLGMLHLPVESALAATHREQIQTARGGEALGWMINTFDTGRCVLTFKDGMVSGYCAYIGLDLDAHVAVVVLSNKFSWDEKVGQNLLLRLAEAGAVGSIKSDGQ
jgi:CubicO group peptidase (beta-lactamase class C family)